MPILDEKTSPERALLRPIENAIDPYGRATDWHDCYRGRTFRFGLVRWNLFAASITVLLLVAIPIIAVILYPQAPFWPELADAIWRGRSK